MRLLLLVGDSRVLLLNDWLRRGDQQGELISCVDGLEVRGRNGLEGNINCCRGEIFVYAFFPSLSELAKMSSSSIALRVSPTQFALWDVRY